MNKAGLLGYAGNANNNIIIALQVETASCIENISEIAAVPGADWRACQSSTAGAGTTSPTAGRA